MKILFFTILFLSTFAVSSVYSCTLLITPISDFDKSEYIFIGEVIGYTNEIKFNQNLEGYIESDDSYRVSLAQANGLIIRVKEAVNLPKIPKTHLEIFPYGLGAMCENLGASQLDLKRDYPKNSEVLVVAREAKALPHTLTEGNYRLEIGAGSKDFVILNRIFSIPKLTTVETFFDYKRNTDSYAALGFEIRKDLLRLEKAEDKKERNKIFKRISYLRKSNHYVDLYGIFRKYFASSQKAERLYRKNLRFNDFPKKFINDEINRIRKFETEKSSNSIGK